jgi:hypothetical protein
MAWVCDVRPDPDAFFCEEDCLSLESEFGISDFVSDIPLHDPLTPDQAGLDVVPKFRTTDVDQSPPARDPDPGASPSNHTPDPRSDHGVKKRGRPIRAPDSPDSLSSEGPLMKMLRQMTGLPPTNEALRSLRATFPETGDITRAQHRERPKMVAALEAHAPEILAKMQNPATLMQVLRILVTGNRRAADHRDLLFAGAQCLRAMGVMPWIVRTWF